MKVYIEPKFKRADKGEGGIRRVVENQLKYLPDYGIEIVDTPAKADVVNTHGIETVDHPTVVVSNHGLYWSGYHWDNWAHQANEKIVRFLRNANVKGVTVPSQFVATSLQRGTLIDPIVVYHGVDTEEWKPPKKREKYVVWAKNRVDAICDPVPLNNVARLLPNQKFITTYGDTRLYNVTELGTLPYPEMKRYIQEASIYLATVKETGNQTLMEAMSAGVVPVGFRWGVNPEIIEHKVNGYLVEPDDYSGLAEGIEYCLKHQAEMSIAAREAIQERFQVRDRIKDYIGAFEKALHAEDHLTKTVSVVITAYKLEEYLPQAVESVIKQDFEDWELIIVDDNSPDRCGEIADEYASKDSRIRVIHNKQNVYLAEARNLAFRNSRGKYLLPLDADDMLEPRAIGKLVRGLEQQPNIHIATGSMAVIEPDGSGFVSGWPTKEPGFSQQIRHRNQVPYCSMYRRWVWEDTGGYRRRWKSAEDAEFWTRAMSFGAKPAKVTDDVTLIYRNRSDSMSHTIREPDWTSWFIWSRYPQFTPYAASDKPEGKTFWDVHEYGPPEVSVVVPVGPGHEIYLQDCLDSLVNQSMLKWEVIVINDTGRDIQQYLKGFPFAKCFRNPKKGTASARNMGIQLAKSPYIVFLDADDYAQPLLLDVLYKAYKTHGGWSYINWYDQDGQTKISEDWSADGLTKKMLGPITGLYAAEDLRKIGGFDEDCPGWEDWELQLSLLEKGICGVKVEYPGITYRYHTGINRERDFSNKDRNIDYIYNKHIRLYKNKEFFMACKKCGGGGGNSVTIMSPTAASNSVNFASVPDGDFVTLRYTGPEQQKKRVNSISHRGVSYIFSANQPIINVYPKDAEHLLQYNYFERVESLTPSVADVPVVTVDRQVAPVKDTVETLDLPTEVITILQQAGYYTINQIVNASYADLLAIKGIGDARARQIKSVVL